MQINTVCGMFFKPRFITHSKRIHFRSNMLIKFANETKISSITRNSDANEWLQQTVKCKSFHSLNPSKMNCIAKQYGQMHNRIFWQRLTLNNRSIYIKNYRRWFWCVLLTQYTLLHDAHIVHIFSRNIFSLMPVCQNRNVPFRKFQLGKRNALQFMSYLYWRLAYQH